MKGGKRIGGPSLGPLEAVIAAISPKLGRQRLAERLTAQNLRSYDAAARGRRTDGWRANGRSADAEIAAAGPLLRDRMRDLVRNNPMAANAVNVLTTNLVGSGIRPRAKTGNKRLDKKANQIWESFAARCDIDGRLNFDGLTTLAVREMIEGGDVFALRHFQSRQPKGRVPLAIEIKEADHLDDRKYENLTGGAIDGGIEFGAGGARTAYWLFPDHPGQTSRIFARSLISERVAADRVIHLYERQRVQNRGVPWGAPVMRSLRDLDDWQTSELTRKKTEACLVGVVLGEDADEGIAQRQGRSVHTEEDGFEANTTGGGLAVVDAYGAPIEQFEPGMIAYSRGGRDIKFNTPAATGGVYEWNRVQLHFIAAGFRVPYALLTGDLSQTNFSSSRVGLNDFRRLIDAMQWQLIIPTWCQPIWDWCFEAAYLAGMIDRPDIPVEWAPPSFPAVNPLQDAQADLLEVRAGFASLPQKISQRGYDPHEVATEQAEYLKATDDLGLVYDSDPRRVAKSGATQTQQPNPDDDDPPAAPPPGEPTET